MKIYIILIIANLPTHFGHFLWQTSGRCLYEGYITNSTKPAKRFKILISAYVMHIMC